jgi:pyrroloquinoline quinone (PQQ) biosynthesis protein C
MTRLSIRGQFGTLCYIALSGQATSSLISVSRTFLVDVRLDPMGPIEHQVFRSLTRMSGDSPLPPGFILEIHTSATPQLASTNPPEAAMSFPIEDSPLTGFSKRSPTPNPSWILEMEQEIEPYRLAILTCPLVQEASNGILPLGVMQSWMIQLYPFIETFPHWIALNIAKTEDASSRGFMIDNIRVEKRHAEQWVNMAQGFGAAPNVLRTVIPLPEVDALTHWLWSINTKGSLAEGVAATNYAIEGITHDIAMLTVKGFPAYARYEEVRLNKKTYGWMAAHAHYDDMHPIQAMEVVKRYTTTPEQIRKVRFAIQRSLEYMLLALTACYQWAPVGSERQKFSEHEVLPDAAPALQG